MACDTATARHLAVSLAWLHGLDAAGTTGHIAETLTAYHGGWISDDTALLVLQVPPSVRP